MNVGAMSASRDQKVKEVPPKNVNSNLAPHTVFLELSPSPA